ncbi:unnamed protein product, partial [Pylaiella littoralis]
MRPYDAGSGAGKGSEGGNAPGGKSRRAQVVCQACCRRKRKEKRAPATSSTLTSAERVRGKARDTVGSGDIVLCEDAVEWLRDERRKGNEKEITPDYERQIVLETFRSLAEEPQSRSRIVISKGGRPVGGDVDGRRVLFALFPKDLRDEVVMNYYWQARTSKDNVAHSGSSDSKDEGATFRTVLQDVLEHPENIDARMDVVRTAAGIVRGDVRRKSELRNVPKPGARHNYEKELEMKVEPPLESLRTLPQTLVSLVQVMTDLRMSPEMTGADNDRTGEGWVWETESGQSQHAGVCGVEERPAEPGRCTGTSNMGVERGFEGAPPEEISEVHANNIFKTNKSLRSQHRRLLMMCTTLVKAVLPGRHMASHDIKAAQWAKSQKTTRLVINFMAEHGLCVTTSQLQHREDFYAKGIKDEDILDKDATAAAFPFDNCDMDPTMSVLPGEGPHFSNIACTSVTVRDPDLRLEDAACLKRRGQLTLNDVVEGPNPEGG